MPENAMAAVISTMSEEAPISVIVRYEYSNYGLKSDMRIINEKAAIGHAVIKRDRLCLAIQFLVDRFFVIAHFKNVFFRFIDHVFPAAKKE